MYPVIDALDVEAQALSSFIGLLEREQAALIENTLSDLEELARQKGGLAQQLEAYSQERKRLFEVNGIEINADPPHDLLAARFLPELVFPELANRWLGLLQLARHASALNQTNGKLIDTRQQQNQQLMMLLQSNSADLSYDAYGQARLSKRGSSLGKA